MALLTTATGHRMLDGTVRVFLAETLFPLTGIITVAFLTRRLGPEGYGLLVLTATLVSWIEGNMNAMFSRATIKLVGAAEDWHSVGSTWARLHLTASCGAAVLLFLLAVPISLLLNEPVLATYLCLFALDIPLQSLAQIHRNILVGTGHFKEGALARAGRWISRMLFVILLVQVGFSVPGALVGMIGASLVELSIARCYVRPTFSGRVELPYSALKSYVLPLFLSSLSVSCYSSLDLFALKVLGGTVVQAGIYGAAQNLSLFPGLFSMALSPLLLSTLTRMLSRSESDQAKAIGRDAMRLVLGLLPFAASIAGAAPELVALFFGVRYEPAGLLLPLLIFAAVAGVMLSVATAILTAAGRPGATLALTGPLVPLAIIGHLILIPRFGALGAASVTVSCAVLGALATLFGVYRVWNIVPPPRTLARSVFASVLVYTLAVLWPASGFLTLAKLAFLGVLIVPTFLALGEFSGDEIALARSYLGWGTGRTSPSGPAQAPDSDSTLRP